MPDSSAPPPAHIAIIMDGNGRWATARGLPRFFGHRQGIEAGRRTVQGCLDLGITHLTLFGFSTENWRRPRRELRDLMFLFGHFLRTEVAQLHAQGVRLRVIGQRDRLPPSLMPLITHAESLTIDNTRLNMTLAISYGGRSEIVEAARMLAAQAASGALDSADIDEAFFARNLYTVGLPDPDLLIRTSGEKRISNFLLWQCAYSEMIFIDRYWPEFSKIDLEDAIREFHARERRFGATTASKAV